MALTVQSTEDETTPAATTSKEQKGVVVISDTKEFTRGEDAGHVARKKEKKDKESSDFGLSESDNDDVEIMTEYPNLYLIATLLVLRSVVLR